MLPFERNPEECKRAFAERTPAPKGERHAFARRQVALEVLIQPRRKATIGERNIDLIAPCCMLAVLFDGFLMRIIKSKELGQHTPEVYGLNACAAIMTACATVLAFVLPITLHPLALPVVPLSISVFMSRAVANFHRRS